MAYMSLTIEEVEHIAELARLELTDTEKSRYREQLSAVLDYFKDLQSVDTNQISPSFSVTQSQDSPDPSKLRPDAAQKGLAPDSLKMNAPLFEEDQFRVPPVLDYIE